MKPILLSVLLLTAVSTYSQTASPPLQPCTLKVSQAPSVRGLKLGMTIDEVFQLFPGMSDSLSFKNIVAGADGYPQFGQVGLDISPSNWPSKERFVGINSFYLSLFDRRIVGLTVIYNPFPTGARWRNPRDLIQRFSDSLHLPAPKDWIDEVNDPRKRLKCDGFEIVVTANEQATIGFFTEGWEGVRRERLAAFEEQKRREFTP